MEKFEKGKWYKWKWDHCGDVAYIKYKSHISAYTVDYAEVIHDNIHKFYTSTCSVSNCLGEVPLSEIQQYLPKEELTSLPEKWCIKRCREAGDWIDKNSDLPISVRRVGGYANSSFNYLVFPSAQNSHIFNHIPDSYVEISLEECKKFIINKQSLTGEIVDFKSKTKEQEMNELIAEARKRYPTGTKYICPSNGSSQYISNASSKNYCTQYGQGINGGFGYGYLYYNGKWADIIETVKSSNHIEIALASSDIASLKEKPINLTASYRKEFEDIFLLYDRKLSLNDVKKQYPLTQKECIAIQKTTGLEHQKPVIIKSNKKKSKLIIINQK